VARNQGSSFNNSSKLDHSKYHENGLEKIINLVNCEVTFQAIWPIAKSLIKRGGQKAPSTIHDPSGRIFYPVNKANIFTDCLENQFRAHDLCDCDHRQHVEAQVKALLATNNEDTC
jgi:hypothetical protein